MTPHQKKPTATWEAPVNADLLKRGAASPDAPADRRWSSPAGCASRLAGALARLLALVIIGLAAATYLVGGIDAMASTLLRKETRHFLPASGAARWAAAVFMARRPASPEALMQLARLAHVLEPDDPLWARVVKASSRLLGQSLPEGEPLATLAALDAATATAVQKPLEGLGVLAWRTMDPYFIVAVDELAASDATAAAHRFNTLRTPDGLPTSEWYLDELVAAFGDTRPIAFVLVADSTGDGWTPMASPPDTVPAGARRIRAASVGEALRIGLWGLEEYRPSTPDADVVTWWRALAARRGLPTFDQPVANP